MPSAVVVVATIKALKLHGGLEKANLNTENLEALKNGIPNLLRHVSNIQNVYKLPVVVAINKYETDTNNEIELLTNECKKLGVNVKLCDVWANGGKGGIELAKEVIDLCEKENSFSFSYNLNLPIKEKINAIVTKIYGGKSTVYTQEAEESIRNLEKLGFGNLPICIAKTQYSFSDNAKLLGAPKDFEVKVRQVKISAGAGFIVVLTGNILTMPGLPKVPAAEGIDIDNSGKITGLF